jgi:hypothetical protein
MVDDLGRQLLAEIEEEVQRKRASGELPAEFERELDVAFAELAPEGAVEADFRSLMDRLVATATIDTNASVASSRPGVAQLKQVVAKAIAWDLRHLASEVSRVNQRLVRALELLDDRVRALEESALGAGVALPPELAALAWPGFPAGPWLELAAAELASAPGRILHAECRDGIFLAALQASGVDAYGVEPSPLFVDAAEVAVDVRCEGADAHLRSLPQASLGAVVLSGCADTLPVPARVALVDAVLTRLHRGGRIIVLSAGPAVAGDDLVAYDLAPGRPWHAATWAALLPVRGFADVRVVPGGGPYAVIASS